MPRSHRFDKTPTRQAKWRDDPLFRDMSIPSTNSQENFKTNKTDQNLPPVKERVKPNIIAVVAAGDYRGRKLSNAMPRS